MALPTSGTISWSMIQNEFGGSNPINISEYYRGGGLVPNVSVNNAVPTSGTIKASDFYGATNSSIAKSGDAYGYVGEPAPAPNLEIVSTNNVTISGGGLSSVTWSIISGDTFTVINTSGTTYYWRASCSKNQTKTAVYRATGNNGLTIDVNVTAQYEEIF